MNIKSTALGDLHNGRQTCLIETDTDRYILKPRCSKNEEAFDLFCQKLDKLGLCVFARAPRIIKKGENEHTQKVEENLKTDENGADLYYQRAGVLLFFTYLLGSNDLHCENIIASADMPVLIDLETLLTGKARGTSNTYNLSKSVMRSHLLCNFLSSKNQVEDVSGFCGISAKMKNIPYTENGRVYLWDKRDIFINSFEKAYLFTLENKEHVAQLIHIFDECEFRQILRPTKTYSLISTVLAKLSSNQEEYATELLSQAYKKDIDKNRLEKVRLVLQNEVQCVLKGEIPIFYTFGNGVDLYSADKKVLSDHLDLSPVDYALSRLDDLSTEDLKRQRRIISLAIDASTPLDKKVHTVKINKGSLACGEIVAQEVSDCAVDGLSSVFCGLQSGANGNVDFVSYNYSLYQGLLGVLCMYAALYRKTQKTVYKDYIYRFYEEARKVFFKNENEIVLTDSNCSLSDGIAGVLACLEHIYQLTGEHCFFEDAKKIASRLVISDTLMNTDYLNGVGALGVILNKLNTKNAEELFRLLIKIFEKVEPFTTGVAHGSSGLMVSLCALNTSCQSKVVDEKIFSLLQWENQHYSTDDNNWYDLRCKTKKGFMSGWCSGAPGIALARDYIRKNTKDLNIQALCVSDIEKAKTFLKKETRSKRDTLCCGTGSRLMCASSLDLSLDFTYNILQCAEEKGELSLLHIAKTNDRNVSLMQGMAGVAYALAMYGDSLSGGMLI
ncbi:MAG: DUF4135 domain-containing protein [Eubacteriales bacterium]|nr:DUF4135 domain-containing protein [Eubacteriales bacterium]